MCVGMKLKQKFKIKIQQLGIDIFSNQTLKEIADCFDLSSKDSNMKWNTAQRYYLPKSVVKNHNIAIKG